MRVHTVGSLLLCSLTSVTIFAQGFDPALMREASAVREELARSTAALRHYTWTEHTEVTMKGELRASSDTSCRYDASGQVTKTPIGKGTAEERASAISKRPIVRSKADDQDYIERAVSVIQDYMPPKPEILQRLLQNGEAVRGSTETGKSEIRFKDYFKRGDTIIFTYDPRTRMLVRVTAVTYMATPKDPVTLEAEFETLPEGINHLASTTLNANKKKVHVKTRNDNYQKMAQ